MGGGTGPRLGTNGAVSGVTWPSPRPESPENIGYFLDEPNFVEITLLLG